MVAAPPPEARPLRRKRPKIVAEARKEGAHKGMDAGRPLEDDAGPVGAAVGKAMICAVTRTLGVFAIIQY